MEVNSLSFYINNDQNIFLLKATDTIKTFTIKLFNHNDILDISIVEPSNDNYSDFGDLQYEVNIFASIGIMCLDNLNFLFVITDICKLGCLDNHYIHQIKQVEAVCISTGRRYLPSDLLFDTYNSELKELDGSETLNSLSDALKYLSQGSFYYCPTRSLTVKLQSYYCDESYLGKNFEWNGYLMEPVYKFLSLQDDYTKNFVKRSGLFPPIIKGFVGFIDFEQDTSSNSIWLISRLGNERSGTRYQLRGLDDDGHVANFVESEIIFINSELTFSYVIIRGSVPVFWDQQGIQLPYNKIQLTRSPVATQPAFERHLGSLGKSYGGVHIIDLLGRAREQSEQFLSSALEYHVRKSKLSRESLNLTHFDLNQEFIQSGAFMEKLEDLFRLVSFEVPVFSYFVKQNSDKLVLRKQKGIFRVNCFDCLDRTNIAQWFISSRVLDLFIRNYIESCSVQNFLDFIKAGLSDLWAENGDQISVIYTGSGALRSSITRTGKYSIQGFMKDVKRSAKRLYAGHISDESKNETIQLLLGNTQFTSNVKLHEIFELSPSDDNPSMTNPKEAPKSLNIQCVTWNVNGLIPGFQDLDQLFKTNSGFSPDIIAVGFQEIVELNPSQIISVDPERKLLWEKNIIAALKDLYGQDCFSLLVSNQLVGTTLSIFVKNDIFEEIRNVEIGKKMTGLGGMAGNKGSVAVWMRYQAQTFCFVSSHFSAGQNNIQDRNDDWSTVYYELESNSGSTIDDRKYVIWMGDMNYRLNCTRELVEETIKTGDYEKLQQHDQLSSQRREGNVFTGFFEPTIHFAPTYKYDPGTNIYDSSEKARVPSWTDRVLLKGESIDVHSYERCEIDFSDHKPVILCFGVNFLARNKLH